MSKIAELLKLAEQKKEKKEQLEVTAKIESNVPSENNKTIVQQRTETRDHNFHKNKVGTVGTVSRNSTLNNSVVPLNSSSAAPERDFQKVANSVIREVEQGVFNGKSKQMYDYLYSLTRGAIQPRRTIRISKPKLMRGTGIGSPQTFYRNIHHLESLGLIKRTEIIGERSGNEYEVFLPEEVSRMPVQSVQSVQSDQSVQKQVVLVLPETVLTVPTPRPINIGVSATPKTSFKDKTKNDDEAFAALNEVFAEACERISGTTANKNQREKWKALAELLVMELEIASARTKSVSDVPAFLTEHLRRRLAGKPESEKPKIEQTPHAGEDWAVAEATQTLPEALTEKARNTTLKTFADYLAKGQKDFLMCFQKTYTAEDWKWLMTELNIT